MYYASIGLLSVVVMVIVNFEVLKAAPKTKTDKTRSRYRHFLHAVILYLVSDILWGALYAEKLILAAYIDTVAFFICMIFSVLLWTRFVVSYLDNRGRFGKILIGGGVTIFVFQLVALIINFFKPIFFEFKDGTYIPGSARYISLFAQMILFVMASAYALIIAIKAKGTEKAHHRTIGFSGIVMTAFIALQSLFPELPFYAAGCLLATCMIHSFVYKAETVEHDIEMGTAKKMAYQDPLTGVKNKLSYLETLGILETRIEKHDIDHFAIVVFDINGLKNINDTLGHDAGDEYIKTGCHSICATYKHSPVFRIGGDEFVVLLEGEDFENRDSLLLDFEGEMRDNARKGLVVVSGGMATFREGEDSGYSDVFRRADKRMYLKKEELKATQEKMIS